MDLGSLVVTIDGNNSGLDRALKDSTSKVDAAIGQIVGAIGLGAAAWKGMDLAIQGIKFNSMMETAKTSFGIMLGSVDQAKAKLGELKYLADHSNLTFSGLTSATTTLLQFGVAGNEVVPIVRMLGEVAGGDSQKLQQLALVMGQVSSAGKLQGGDLLQLVNAGFNPLNTIAEKTGESMTDLRKRMSDGAISAQEVKEAFKTATSEGGLFFGMMEKNSKTLAGSFSTLGDATDTFLGRTTEAFSGPLLFGVQQVTNLLNIIPGQFSGIALAVGTVTAGVGAFALGVGALTPAFAALGVTINISLLPLLGVTATITAIVAAIGVMGNELHKVNQGAISEMKSNFGEILSSTERGKKAIDDVAQSALAAHGVFNSWVNNGAEFNLALERTSEHLELSKTQVAALLANSKDVTRENKDLAIQYLAQNGLSRTGLTQQQAIAKAAKEYAEYNKDALAAFLERNPKLKEEYDLRQKLSETVKAEKTAQEEYFAKMKDLNALISKNVISETDGYNEKIKLREEYASGLKKDFAEHKVSLDFVATETQRINKLNNDDRNTLAEKATVARNLTTALNEQLVVDLGLKTARKDSFGLLRESNDFVLTTNANLGIQSDLLKDQEAPLSSIVSKHEEVKGIFSLEPTMLEKVTAEINSQPLAIDAVNTELKKQTPLITSTWDVLVKSEKETIVFTEKVTALSMAVDKVKQEFKTWDEVFSQVMVDGLHSVERLIGDGFVALGKSIGHSLVGLKQDDLWQSFAQAAVRSIAKVVEGLGQQLIAMAAVHLLMGDFAGAALAGAAAAGAFVASGVLQGLADGMKSVKTSTDEAKKALKELLNEYKAPDSRPKLQQIEEEGNAAIEQAKRLGASQVEIEQMRHEIRRRLMAEEYAQEKENEEKLAKLSEARAKREQDIYRATVSLNEMYEDYSQTSAQGKEVTRLNRELNAAFDKIKELAEKSNATTAETKRTADATYAYYVAKIEEAVIEGHKDVTDNAMSDMQKVIAKWESVQARSTAKAFEKSKANAEYNVEFVKIYNEFVSKMTAAGVSHDKAVKLFYSSTSTLMAEAQKKISAELDAQYTATGNSIFSSLTNAIKSGASKANWSDSIMEMFKNMAIDAAMISGGYADKFKVIGKKIQDAISAGLSSGDLSKIKAEINTVFTEAKNATNYINTIFSEKTPVEKVQQLAESHLEKMTDLGKKGIYFSATIAQEKAKYIQEIAKINIKNSEVDSLRIWNETVYKAGEIRNKAQKEIHDAELKAEQEHQAALNEEYKKTGDSLASSLTDAMKKGTGEADWTSSILDMLRNMAIDAAMLAGGYADKFKAIGKNISDALVNGFSSSELSTLKNSIKTLYSQASTDVATINTLFSDMGVISAGAQVEMDKAAKEQADALAESTRVAEKAAADQKAIEDKRVADTLAAEQLLQDGYKKTGDSLTSSLTDALKKGTSETDWTSSIMDMFKNMTIDAAILAGGFADRFKAIGKQIQDAISSGLSGDALSGIKDQIGALFTEAKQTTDQVSALFADIEAGGTGAGLTIPAFASGTLSAPGGIALVGERGPELVNLPRGSNVLPADQTRQAISSNKSISISVQSNAPLDPIQTAYQVKRTMEQLAFQGAL